MLFPIKEASELAKEEENKRITDQGQFVSPNCYFMKQTVGNAVSNAFSKVNDF